MNRIALFILFSFATSALLLGQEKATLQGYIANQEGKPVEKVIITVEKQAEHAYSDANGKYKLTIPALTEIKVRFQYFSSDTVLYINAAPNEKIEQNIVIKAHVLNPVDVAAKYNDGYVRVDPRHN